MTNIVQIVSQYDNVYFRSKSKEIFFVSTSTQLRRIRNLSFIDPETACESCGKSYADFYLTDENNMTRYICVKCASSNGLNNIVPFKKNLLQNKKELELMDNEWL